MRDWHEETLEEKWERTKLGLVGSGILVGVYGALLAIAYPHMPDVIMMDPGFGQAKAGAPWHMAVWILPMLLFGPLAPFVTTSHGREGNRERIPYHRHATNASLLLGTLAWFTPATLILHYAVREQHLLAAPQGAYLCGGVILAFIISLFHAYHRELD